MKYIVKTNEDVTVNDFLSVRDTTNFMVYDINDHKESLKNSLFVVGLYLKDKCIAVGRVVGDNKTTFFLKDIIVAPKYKSNGAGKLIMNEIFKYIDKNATNNAYIGLMASKDSESFYERFDFIKRPNNNLGSGMIKFYDKK